MDQHGPKLAGTSKDLLMGVSMLSFSSFHSRFSERAEFPFRGQICKRAEQLGGCLGKSVDKCWAEAAGNGALWKSWEEISWGMLSEISSHLLYYRVGCHALNGPWEMLRRLALENGSSRDLSTLSSAETLQLQSQFINYPSSKLRKVWIYLLAPLTAYA